MTFQIHEVEQGSDAWHELRLAHSTASEAPIMMGDSSKGKRNELLTLKKTGVAKEVSRYVQEKVFDPGHAVEAAQRSILEDELGEELYPTTASRVVNGIALLASTDGQTMDGTILYEHKQWNADLAAMVRSGELSGEYFWQLEQQLLVFGAEKVIFVTSDGTKDNREMMDYFAVPGRAAQLLGGWDQFLDDLTTFEAKEPVEKLQARSIENLPALVLQLSGRVATSNLDEYKAQALAFVNGIKTDLVTDQDFVDAEATVKFCDTAEKKIKDIKNKALENTADIKAAFDALDELAEAMRKKRLALNKQVTEQKAARKEAIRSNAEAEFLKFMAELNKEFGPRVRMPDVECDIATAMSGKRNLDSLQDAADTTVAKAKIKAAELATVIRANLAVLRELDAKYRGLFRDIQEIILKSPDDFGNLVKLRVNDFDAEEERKAKAEEERQAQERERIRREEQERLQREQQEREEEERRQAAEAEAATQAAATPVAEPTPEPTPEPVADPAPTASNPVVTGMDLASGKDETIYHTTAPASLGKSKRKVVAKLTNMEALLNDIVQGVMPMDLVQINPEAVQAFVDSHGFAPTGFGLGSVG